MTRSETAVRSTERVREVFGKCSLQARATCREAVLQTALAHHL